MTTRLALRTSEAAALLGVDDETIRRHLAAGRMPGRKLGGTWLVPIAALERWLEDSMAYVATPLADRFWSKVDKSGDCWLWTASKTGGGYGQIGITRSRNGMAHRVAWELTYGPIPDGILVLHHCDNPPCVRPSHLFLGTDSDNTMDMLAKGRGNAPRGEAHPQAKLTWAIVDEVRASDASARELAERFNVVEGTIRNIRTGRVWNDALRDARPRPGHDLLSGRPQGQGSRGPDLRQPPHDHVPAPEPQAKRPRLPRKPSSPRPVDSPPRRRDARPATGPAWSVPRSVGE